MIVLTGAPGCAQCTMVENIVKKLGYDYEKVDITENQEYYDLVISSENRMPAAVLVMSSKLGMLSPKEALLDRYIVSPQTPAKIPQIKQFLEDNHAY